jgi:polyribonucleotide nucleotidyltransferase
LKQDNSPEFASIIGTITALCISDIPFNGPIGGIILGYMDGKVIINPTAEQRKHSRMYVTLSADKEKIIMIEAGANEIPDEVMLDAIKEGHEHIKGIITFIEEIAGEVGKEKLTYTPAIVPDDLYDKVESICRAELTEALMNDDKATRERKMLRKFP